jgi:hypothetical protein
MEINLMHDDEKTIIPAAPGWYLGDDAATGWGVPEQVETRIVATEEIVGSLAFRRGVEEVREGRPPRFDAVDDWCYEWGRQWALLAPRNLPLRIGFRVNPKAVALYDRAADRGWICPR